MILVEHGKIKRQLPENFNEMDRRMLHAFYLDVMPSFRKIFDGTTGQVLEGKEGQAQQLHMMCMLILCDFNIPFMDAIGNIYPVKDEKGEVMTDEDGKPLTWCPLDNLLYERRVIDFMFKDVTLTRLEFPKLHVRKQPILYGPGENFQNLRVAEYFFADSLFLNYKKTGSQENLLKLAACLYRPQKAGYQPNAPDTDGDPREPFNPLTVETRLEKIRQEKLPEELLSCLFLYFEGCRNKLVELYSYMFEPSGGSKGPALLPAESLVELCGGAFEYEKNQHLKAHLLFTDLNAKAKINIQNQP